MADSLEVPVTDLSCSVSGTASPVTSGPLHDSTPRSNDVGPRRRIPFVDALRGTAAFAVMWHHFTCGSGFVQTSLLRWSGAYGWLGVHLFFVISGFVLPVSLDRRRYRLRQFGVELLRRLIRLEPPYLASLAVAVGYADLVAVGGTILNQSGKSIEIIAIWMLVYVSISLVTSLFMNWFNAKMALVER